MILSHNLYAYCSNSPVVLADPSGCIDIGAVLLFCITTGALVSIPTVAYAPATEEDIPTTSAVDQVADAVKGTWESIKGYCENVYDAVLNTFVETASVTTECWNSGPYLSVAQITITKTTERTLKGSKTGIYHYYNYGTEAVDMGTGISLGDWAGAYTGIGSDARLFYGMQVTPWLHGQVTAGTGGLEVTVGINKDETAYDLNLSLSPQKLAFAMVMVAFPLIPATVLAVP